MHGAASAAEDTPYARIFEFAPQGLDDISTQG